MIFEIFCDFHQWVFVCSEIVNAADSQCAALLTITSQQPAASHCKACKVGGDSWCRRAIRDVHSPNNWQLLANFHWSRIDSRRQQQATIAHRSACSTSVTWEVVACKFLSTFVLIVGYNHLQYFNIQNINLQLILYFIKYHSSVCILFKIKAFGEFEL